MVDEPTPTEKPRTGWRGLVTLPTAIVATAVTAAVTWGVTELITSVREEATARDPVTVSVESNPARTAAFAGLPVDARLPAGTQPTTGPGSFCSGFLPWARQHGGSDAGATRLQVVLQGRTAGQLLVSNARAVVVAREAPAAGIEVRCPPAGEAELRALSIDLDQRDPRARYESAEAREFGFTLEQGEIETFVITATARQATYTWYLELTVVADGETRTIRVDDGGQPFRTSTPIHGQPWEWDYEGSWIRPTDDGTWARVPAGGRLEPGPS